jgi:hypothetical protein
MVMASAKEVSIKTGLSVRINSSFPEVDGDRPK